MGISRLCTVVLSMMLVTGVTSAQGTAPQAAVSPAVRELNFALSLIASQTALYQIQHKDASPDFGALQWKQLTSRTDADGQFGQAAKYGPYLKQVPVNPLNGFSTIVVIEHPAAGMRLDRGQVGYVFEPGAKKFWSTDASGQILLHQDLSQAFPGLSAPAVIPWPVEKLTRANYERWIGVLRSVVALYKLQHHDASPDLTKYPNWEQLTKRTDPDGKLNEKGQCGPYLAGAPTSPLTKSFLVERLVVHPPEGYKPAIEKCGYVIDIVGGGIWAVDEDGVIIVDPPVLPVGNDAAANELRESQARWVATGARHLHVTLGIAQSALMAWRSKHGGAMPDFERYNQWEQLTSRTNDAGTPDPRGAQPTVFQAAPRNALNGCTAVYVVEHPPVPGTVLPRSGYGFVFCKSDSRFWPTDATAQWVVNADLKSAYPAAFEFNGSGEGPIPDLASRSEVEATQVRGLRKTLNLYKEQHGGNLPDFKTYADWEQLTCRTDSSGKPTPKGEFGPYLVSRPVNLLNASSHVCVVDEITTKPFSPSEPESGFVLDMRLGSFSATNARWQVPNPTLPSSPAATASNRVEE